METMTVGQLVKMAGINVETIRYYENRGLMPEPKRSESRYRYYSEVDVSRLLFIKRAKEIGFSLKEILELLNLKVTHDVMCDDVRLLAEHKIEDVDKKIEDLNKIRAVLNKLVNQCLNEKTSDDDCPILEALGKLNQQ